MINGILFLTYGRVKVKTCLYFSQWFGGFCYLLDLKQEDRGEAAGTRSILLNAGLPLFTLAQSLAWSLAQSKRQ